MSKAKMLGYNKPYTPNNRATTPGRKKPTAMILAARGSGKSNYEEEIKRLFEKKEK